jgi:hypothetical protein
MNCPHCRKGWIDIDVAGEVEHDLCHNCNGTGQAPDHLTPEQALADIRAVRRDRADSHWLDCAIALADWNERFKAIHAGVIDHADELRTENAKLRAELDKADAYRNDWKRLDQANANLCGELQSLERTVESLRAELDAIKALPAAPEPPALARFLPRRPADVPATPDGWVYVGPFMEKTADLPDNDLIKSMRVNGEWYDSLAWTAPADIWHRFGLLAPSEGGGWIPHTPGADAPNDAPERVDILLCDEVVWNHPLKLMSTSPSNWRGEKPASQIIGWRPALAEVAT